jgi:hypothetical protein
MNLSKDKKIKNYYLYIYNRELYLFDCLNLKKKYNIGSAALKAFATNNLKKKK